MWSIGNISINQECENFGRVWKIRSKKALENKITSEQGAVCYEDYKSRAFELRLKILHRTRLRTTIFSTKMSDKMFRCTLKVLKYAIYDYGYLVQVIEYYIEFD